MKNFKLFSLIFVLGLGIMFTSCGDDPVVGCTDEAAENYDANATEAGDCVYAADKFIGDFVGTSECMGGPLGIVMGLSNDTLGFSVSAEIGGGPNDVSISIPIQGTPVAFPSTVEGDVLTVDANLTGLPFPFMGTTVTVDVIATGTQTYDSSSDSTTGTINVTVLSTDDIAILNIAAGDTLDAGACVISGVKQ